ncbi:MAG: hypothetical protein WBA13_22070 [Microcoleaceae cyanobacterium]
MILKYLPKTFIASILALFLLLSGCATVSAPPTADPTSTEQVSQPVAAQPVSGGDFNQFFPKGKGDYNVTFRQEKTGFAQAQLSQAGSDVALLSINDIANNPSAANKFNSSSQSIAGYPAVNQGRNTTAILVSDRYQVKIKSNSDSFTPSDREQWLKQFNLTGLARLK